MQAKRIQVNTANPSAVGGTVHVNLTAPTEPREEINFHNIWAAVTAEPEISGTNAAGTWVLYIKPAGGSNIAFTHTLINTEDSNAFIVACGLWNASNEAPWTSVPIQIKTSRTLNAGDSLALTSTLTGVTGGAAVRMNVLLCAHTVRK